jgi:hypothetical protein
VVSCKIHPSLVNCCIIRYNDYYRKRSDRRLGITDPISACPWRIYFPGMKSQERGGITDFENYCIRQEYNAVARKRAIPMSK